MKRYCFDNSGFSNPHETMPEDIPIFGPLWKQMEAIVISGSIATTAEIYDEMCKIPGPFGMCLKSNKPMLLMEVGDSSWEFETYIRHYNRMQTAYHAYISEYSHGGSKRTIGLTDMTIIALTKTLDLPVVSMEVSAHQSPDKRRIPDICNSEGIVHYTFNDFLKKEGIGS